MDALPSALTPWLQPPGAVSTSAPERDAMLAVPNGVLVDHRAATGHPLAIPMLLRYPGQALPSGKHMALRQQPAMGSSAAALRGLIPNPHRRFAQPSRYQCAIVPSS